MAELSSEKRVLLAFALSFLVLALWAGYMRKKYPPPEALPAEAPVSAPAAAPPARPVRAAPESEPRPKVEPRLFLTGSEERTIVVETDVATIVFSSRGAQVRSWTLADYTEEGGRPLELIQGRTTGLGYPLELELASREQEQKLNQALYLVNTDESRLTAPAELLFEWSDGRLQARKRFRFNGGYLCEVETEVFDDGRPVAHRLSWRGGFGAPGDAAPGFPILLLRGPAGVRRHLAAQGSEPTGWLFKSLSPFPYTGEASYAGIEDRYFAAVFFPEAGALAGTAASRQWTPAGEQKPQPVGSLAVGAPAGGVNRFRLFVGPKEIDTVETVATTVAVPGLADELVDFGWFWWIAKPLFLGMKWMYEHWLPNYGWVIVLLTVIINTVLFPLKWRSMESAWKMQKLAPQMRAIQERYKQYKFNDPRKQQMQQETMALYKEHGVNPLGGCLPLLLQLPFFYGFYKVLSVAIELRHAPWFGWIQDLSQKDPVYVLPIVMTLTMYISTKMTPMTTADPAQQRMMQMFPLIFGFMFLQVSSGLVLYWMMSSVVGIGQQWWINRYQRRREQAEKLAAKERRKKKPKGGEAESPEAGR